MSAILHAFLFSSGQWLGEGTITFSSSPEELHFYTSWHIDSPQKGRTVCTQKVQIVGADEEMINTVMINEVRGKNFLITLDNSLLEKVEGKGIVDKQTITWEFREQSEMEGFESYHLQANGEYVFHGEYLAPDTFRTLIDGRLWKKET